MNETGPADRQDNLVLGAAPYLARFPSGESVLAYDQASRQRIRLGDRDAREFGEPETFLPGTGFWGNRGGLFPAVGDQDAGRSLRRQ